MATFMHAEFSNLLANQSLPYSIILPFFNREKTIARAIKSVLAQTYKNWELLAIDDGSTDDSVSIVRSFGDSRIQMVSQGKNSGAAAARNLGIIKSRGQFICFLDSDDAYEPRFLETILQKWNTLPASVGLLWTGCIYHRQVGSKVVMNKGYWTPVIKSDPYHTFLSELKIGTNSGISVRRGVFENIGGFNPDLPAAEDTEFFLRLSRNYSFDHIPLFLINIFQTGKDRLSLKFDRIAIAYNKFIPGHLDAINKSKTLRLKFFYKLMWLNYHLGDRGLARAYFRKLLKDRLYHRAGWLIFLIFEIFGKKLGSRLHIFLSLSSRTTA